MSDIEELVKKIESLNLQQRRTISDLIEAITSSDTPGPPSSTSAITPRTHNRIVNQRFTSANGFHLAIGDKVVILNNRKTGKVGDTAVILKFNKKFVALSLEKNHSYTQRAAKNLELIQEKHLS